jgi:hypothetical protein
MATLEETMRGRFARYDNVPGLDHVRKAFESTMAVREKFIAKAKEVGNDARKSPLGKQETLRDYVKENAHAVRRSQKTVEKIKIRHAHERTKLLPKPDPATADLRREARQILREQKSPVARMNLLLSGSPDPTFLAAALETANVMSGIDDVTRNLVFERLVETTSPGALAAWEARGDAIEHLEVVAQMFEGSARTIADIPVNAFGTFLKEAIGDTSRLDADIERQLSDAA